MDSKSKHGIGNTQLFTQTQYTRGYCNADIPQWCIARELDYRKLIKTIVIRELEPFLVVVTLAGIFIAICDQATAIRIGRPTLLPSYALTAAESALQRC